MGADPRRRRRCRSDLLSASDLCRRGRAFAPPRPGRTRAPAFGWSRSRSAGLRWPSRSQALRPVAISRAACAAAGRKSLDESQFRDAAHGFMVWAVGVLFSGLLLAMTAGSALTTATQSAAMVGGGAASGATNAAAQQNGPLRLRGGSAAAAGARRGRRCCNTRCGYTACGSATRRRRPRHAARRRRCGRKPTASSRQRSATASSPSATGITSSVSCNLAMVCRRRRRNAASIVGERGARS